MLPTNEQLNKSIDKYNAQLMLDALLASYEKKEEQVKEPQVGLFSVSPEEFAELQQEKSSINWADDSDLYHPQSTYQGPSHNPNVIKSLSRDLDQDDTFVKERGDIESMIDELIKQIQDPSNPMTPEEAQTTFLEVFTKKGGGK